MRSVGVMSRLVLAAALLAPLPGCVSKMPYGPQGATNVRLSQGATEALALRKRYQCTGGDWDACHWLGRFGGTAIE